MTISVGSVAVDVVPDTRGFATKLKAKLKDISANIKIDADTTAAKTKLDEATRPRQVKIQADADTAKAKAKIDDAARNRKAKIDVSAAGAGLTAILALGPALIPITAAVAGLGAAFALPVAAAGAGLTLGGIVAGVAIKQTETQKKKIDELAKKVAAAQQALANTNASIGASSANSLATAQRSHAAAIKAAQQALASATTASARASAQRRLDAANAALSGRQASISASNDARRAAAQRRVTEATAAYNAALKGLTPAQARFIKSQEALKSSFKGLVTTAGPAIFGPVVTGMDALAKIMPTLKGPLTAVSRAVGTLLGDIDKSASGPAFKNFMNAFGAASASAIVSFGRIVENFGKGFVGLALAFAPLSKGLVGGLTDLSKRFAEWGTTVGPSKGFQSFLAYLRDTGPKVAATIGSVFKALVRVGIALAPIGALALGGIKVLADVIRVIPVPVLTATAAGIIAVVVALKGYQVFEAASSGLTKLTAAINGLRGADTQLSKTSVAVRGLAGVGGIGLLTESATTSNKALGILGSAGGGALLGFAAGGPVGAAVGAGAGALFGLATQATKVKNTLQRSKPVVADYVSTLNSLTGATTRATRASAFDALQKSGAIDAGRKFGLSSRTLVDAALGNKKALDIYNKAIQGYTTARDQLLSSGNLNDQGAQTTAEKKHLADLAGAFNTLTDAVSSNSTEFKKDKSIQRDQRLAVLDLGKVLKGFPRKAITEIGLKGFPDTAQQLATLAEKYKLTPPELSTLIKVSGVPTSVSEVERLKRELDKLRDKTIKVKFQVTGIPLAPTSALFGPGIHPEGAGARGAIINRPTVALIGENGPERLTPLDQTPGNAPLPGGRAVGGVTINIDTVVAHDYADFMGQMNGRARNAGIGGTPVSTGRVA